MPFRDLGFLPKAEAMEIEGGKRVLGYAPTLEVAQRLGETFDNAHNKHQCGDQTTCEKANATEPSPTRIRGGLHGGLRGELHGGIRGWILSRIRGGVG